MNDVQHVEAARKLAEHLLTQYPDFNKADLAKKAFGRVVGRPSSVADMIDIVSLVSSVEKDFRSQPENAKKLVSTGELPVTDSLDPVVVAAWTVAINALLNRDDVISQS